MGDLTYWEVSQQTKVQTLLVSLVVDIGQNSALQWGVRGVGGISQIAHTSYSRHQRTNPLRHAELFISQQKFYLSRIYYFFQISQLASCLRSPSNLMGSWLPEEQIFYGTDPLRAPEIYQLYMFLLALAFKIDEKAVNYEHYLSILVSFLGKPSISVGKMEHFSGETKA